MKQEQHNNSKTMKPLMTLQEAVKSMNSITRRYFFTIAVMALPAYAVAAATPPDTLSTAAKAETLTLDSCLSLARQNNKQLRRAQLDIDKAEQVKHQALTKYFPQVKATALGYHSLHPWVEVGIEDFGNASVRDLLTTLYGNYGAALGLDNTLSLFQYGYQAGVTALQPVYMGGKIVAGNRLAQVGIEAARLQTAITERDLLEQVEESYWLVVGLTEKQQTLQAATALLDTIHRTVQVAVDAGLALPTDLLQVELRQSEMQRTRIQLDNGLALAKRALWQSIAPATSPTETQPAPNGLDSVRFDAIHGDSVLLTPPEEGGGSPESSLLALQVRAAELQHRMTLAEALPQVAVGAHYGYSNLQTNVLRNGLGSKTGNGAVFVSVSVPLSGWWETGHKLRASSLAVEQARLEQAQGDELLDLRVQQTHDKMVEAYYLMAENRHSVEIARENYRLSAVNYRAGLGTVSDLLAAQTACLQAENGLTDAQIAYRVHLRRYCDLAHAQR